MQKPGVVKGGAPRYNETESLVPRVSGDAIDPERGSKRGEEMGNLWRLVLLTVLGAGSLWAQDELIAPSFITIQGEFHQDLGGDFVTYSLPLLQDNQRVFSDDQIDLVRRIDRTGATSYQIRHTYKGSEWRFMRTLSLTIDGNPFNLRDDHPRRQPGTLSGVVEILSYTIPSGTVDLLRNAASVNFRYAGTVQQLPSRTLDAIKSCLLVLKKKEFSDHPEKITLP